MTKNSNFRQCRGSKRPLAAGKVLAVAKDPTPQRGREGGFFHPRVCRSEAELRLNEELRRSVAVLRCGEATVHSMEMLCFCFVLFFRYSEDLSIGLIRIL